MNVVSDAIIMKTERASQGYLSLAKKEKSSGLIFLVQENPFNAAEVGFAGGGASDG